MRLLRSPNKEQGIPDLQRVVTDIFNLVSPASILTVVDYTTSGNVGHEYVLCNNTSTVTITLTPRPSDLSLVTVVRGNTGAVSISGAINGGSSLALASRYDTAILQYFEALSKWIKVN